MAEDIKIESYQDIAFDGAWKSRSRSLWAIPILGAITGAAIGAVVPIFPLMVAGSAAMPGSALAFFGNSIAVFAGLGLSSGFAIGILNGATSGAAASVGKEQEKRFKTLLANNGLSIETPAPAIEPERPKSFFGKMKDTADTYFNWRVALTFALLGAAGGLIMATGFTALGQGTGMQLHAGMEKLLGNAILENANAMTAYFTGVMATFGAIFGGNFPKIAGSMNRFIGGLLSGETLGKQFGPAAEKSPQKTTDLLVSANAEPLVEIQNEPRMLRPAQNFASYQQLIIQQASEPEAGLKRQ